MSKKIKVHDADVKTATITVRAMKIDGRQVTMAVFRQLMPEPLVDPWDYTLKGDPWGVVNYRWGDCKNTDPHKHLHVVWQLGDELRRACYDTQGDPLAVECAVAVKDIIARWQAKRLEPLRVEKGDGPEPWCVYFQGGHVAFFPAYWVSDLDEGVKISWDRVGAEDNRRLQKVIEQSRMRVKPPSSCALSELQAFAARLSSHSSGAGKNKRQRREEMLGLPQLFIAT